MCNTLDQAVVEILYIFFFFRALLPSESNSGPGDPGDDQRLMVSRQRSPFVHHFSDIITWSRPVPHQGLPLPHGMHHLWDQLHRHHGGVQPQWAKVQLHLSGLLVQWVKMFCTNENKRQTFVQEYGNDFSHFVHWHLMLFTLSSSFKSCTG